MSRCILLRMRRALMCAAASLLFVSCHSSSTIVQPSPPPVSTTVPAFLTAGAIAGTGTDAGHAAITVKVQNVNGEPMKDVPVTFETDRGAIDPARAVTLPDGTTSARLTAAATATVVVASGTLSRKLLVTMQSAPTAPSNPTEPSPAPPSNPAVPLSVTLVFAAGPAGSDTTFGLSTNGSIAQEVWTFGDSSPSLTTTTHHASHAYASPGAYLAGVTVTDTLGRSASANATVTINAAAAPPPPPAPSYTVTLVASPSTVIIGSSSTLTATATPQNGAPAPTSYAFDCDNSGTPEFTVAVNFASCPYALAGTITSSVRVTGGSAISGASVVVTVTTPPLVVNVVPSAFSTAVGAPVTFTATVTSLGPVPATFQWSWDDTNDGTAELIEAAGASPRSRSVTYGTVGPKTLKVTVTDPATGRTASGLVAITVS